MIGEHSNSSAIPAGLNGHIPPSPPHQTNGIPPRPTPPTTNGHARTQSNPLAPPFIVSAPGKTIVYGEHAVVHGHSAIAAAISLRSYLLCTTLSKSHRTVRLHFADLGLDHTWHIPALPWATFHAAPTRPRYTDRVTALDPARVAALSPHLRDLSPAAPPDRRKIHHNAALAFLYLFLSLGSPASPACIYALRSTIPIAAGLGSSASVSVCLATALLLQSRALSGPHPDQPPPDAAQQLARINDWAFVGELLIHGNPSGVDNTVATHGHAVLFQRRDYTAPPSVELLRRFPELPLWLIDTRQPKSTAAEVAKVAALKAAHPAVAEHIFAAIDAITQAAHALVSEEDTDGTDTKGPDTDGATDRARSPPRPRSRSTSSTASDSDSDAASPPAPPPPPHPDSCTACLGALMDTNHHLLAALGVSHPRLERLRYLVGESGVGWTKLTGAGGGGCAITLLRPEVVGGGGGGVGESGRGRETGRGEGGADGREKEDGEGEEGGAAAEMNGTGADARANAPLRNLEQTLAAEGFERYATTLGGDGVGVLYPAVLGGREIDLGGFLGAEGREGVEGLMGGDGSGGKIVGMEREREGEEGGRWMYWRV